MNLFEHMDAMASSFTKTDHYIYTQCKKFTTDFAENSLTTITQSHNISQPALTRFAKKLGFNGFNEFQFALAMQVEEGTLEGKEKTPAQSYAEALIETERVLNSKVLAPVLDILKNCKDVYATGAHLSSLPARYIDYSLKVISTVHSEFLSLDAIPSNYPKNSVLFLFSVETGIHYQPLFKNRDKHSKNPYIILITLNPKHPLRNKVNHTIVLPKQRIVDTERNVLPETLAFLMFADVLTRKMQALKY
ncbi:MAG: hypothetical protein SO042_05205 [Bulleidia sp.]|nr:hypothetical protein [Bulleidia sp.]